MHDVYKLKKMLCEELEAFGKKNEIDVSELEIVDKLAHSIKNIQKVLEKYEEEEEGYSGAYRGMRDRGMYYDDRYMRDGMSYARGGQGGSRGGNRSGMRGGRGGYSREGGRGGYSMADESMQDMIGEMRELMDDMPEEKRREMQKFISKMEQM